MVHGDSSKDSESSHNHEPECVAVLGFGRFEDSSGQGKGNGGTVVLKGVDHAGGKSSHFLAPDVHGRGGADDGVGGVGGKGDEDKDGAPKKNSPCSGTDVTQKKNDSSDGNDPSFDDVKGHSHGRAVTLKKSI